MSPADPSKDATIAASDRVPAGSIRDRLKSASKTRIEPPNRIAPIVVVPTFLGIGPTDRADSTSTNMGQCSPYDRR